MSEQDSSLGNAFGPGSARVPSETDRATPAAPIPIAEDCGTITTPEGPIKITKWVRLDEVDGRVYSICMSEEGTLLVQLESIVGGRFSIQNMHLTERSFLLMMFAMHAACERFGIDQKQGIADMLKGAEGVATSSCGCPETDLPRTHE